MIHDNENFVKEVRIELEFSELFQKAFTKIEQFWKLLSRENSILLKGLKSPDTKSSKSTCLLSTFFCIIYIGGHRTSMCGLTSKIWSLVWQSWVSSAADLGGIFIFLDVTAPAFAQIINMKETEPSETDWIVINSDETTGQASLFVYF